MNDLNNSAVLNPYSGTANADARRDWQSRYACSRILALQADAIIEVFGRTVNPYHSSFTPGGSSGGEGALLALKGCKCFPAARLGRQLT